MTCFMRPYLKIYLLHWQNVFMFIIKRHYVNHIIIQYVYICKKVDLGLTIDV